MFTATESTQKVGWAGRWFNPRTLEIYIQEVSACTLLQVASPDERARIRRFVAAAEPLLCQLAY